MWRRTLFICGVVLGVMLALVWPQPTYACSCVWPPPDPATAFSSHTAVFSGTVAGIFDYSLFYALRQWLGVALPYGRSISFRVIGSWKGVTTTTVAIKTGYGGGDCGYSFAAGGQYLVYAFQGSMYAPPGQTELETGICSRTTDLALATTDLNYLQTLPKLALTPAPSSWLPLYLGLFVALVVIFLMAAWWFRRHRASHSNSSL